MKTLIILFLLCGACYGQWETSEADRMLLKRVKSLESCIEELIKVNETQNIIITSYEARIEELEAKVEELEENQLIIGPEKIEPFYQPPNFLPDTNYYKEEDYFYPNIKITN
jgi:hypothetical protein